MSTYQSIHKQNGLDNSVSTEYHDQDIELTEALSSKNSSHSIAQEDEVEGESIMMTSATTTNKSYIVQSPEWYSRTFVKDDNVRLGDLILIESAALKLAKFCILTYTSIFGYYFFIRWLDLEHDKHLDLDDMWKFEAPLIFRDSVVFFLVGRLYNQSGVDNFLWLGMIFVANIYSSYLTAFPIFQHSATLYEMHCRWPIALWVFTFLIIPVVCCIGWYHMWYAYKQKLLVQKMFEIVFVNLFLLVPNVTSKFFHLHHWYAGLLVGMHLNFPTLFSRISMAWCWGCYINGIAVYGRDPVLTCEYGLALSYMQHCPYISCYIQALQDTANHTETSVKIMHTPNWRNCSAEAFHP